MYHRFAHWTRRLAGLAVMSAIVASVAPRLEAADYGGYRPHYQGYGVNTRGGRGGAILRVTNLNDSGAGSLRAALEASGPRIVIFEISGTINLHAEINVLEPYLTVAGQTAPSPGITIRYRAINIDTHDVVFQHFRMRMGDTYYNADSLSNVLRVRNNAYNVVLDHLSLSWGVGTILAVASDSWRQVSVLDCVIGPNLRIKNTETGMAALNAFSWQGEVTYARNLFVHNSNRSPWFGSGTRGSLINNVIYGSGNSDGAPESQFGFFQIIVADYDWYGNNEWWHVEAAAENNLFIDSTGTGSGILSGTHPTTKSIDVSLSENISSRDTRMYLSGNVGPYMTLQNQWAGVDFYNGVGYRSAIDYVTPPSWHSAFGFNLLQPANVLTNVLANAGARPLDRDSIDVAAARQAAAGAVNDVANMGTRIVSQSDVGGWPTLAVNARSLQLPANPHAVATGESFRTNVEVWLETMARALESSTGSSGLSRPTNIRLSPSSGTN